MLLCLQCVIQLIKKIIITRCDGLLHRFLSTASSPQWQQRTCNHKEPKLKVLLSLVTSPPRSALIKLNVMEAAKQSGLLLFVVGAQQGNMNLLASTYWRLFCCYGAAVRETEWWRGELWEGATWTKRCGRCGYVGVLPCWILMGS